MNNNEKIEFLRSTIEFLYSKEGRSKTYISRLLDVDRRALTYKIKEWDLPKAEPRRHANPSTQKYINKNRTKIKSLLDKDVSISEIAKILNVSRYFLQDTVIPNDKILDEARKNYINRIHKNATERKDRIISESKLEYIETDLPDEIWKPIKGYSNYMVSNMGRIKSYKKRYDKYSEVKSQPNKESGRLYVTLTRDDGKVKNLQLARLVAFAFVDNSDPKTKKTVNHEDGNILNCKASNLTWMTQQENSLHCYRVLGKANQSFKTLKFEKIIYKNKYEFKTIAAFSRFVGISTTQARRWMDDPKKHDIEIIGMIVTTRKNVNIDE